MTSEEVEKLILNQIENKWDISNLHGINLTECILKPFKQKYIYALDKSQSFNLWTVLIESENGYRVFYDEDKNMFGLATKSENDELLYLSCYGNFLDAIENM